MRGDTKVFLRELLQVVRGRRLWRLMRQKYSLDMNMDFVLLLPENQDECAYEVLRYLNCFIEQLERRKTHLAHMGIPIIRRNEKFLVLTDCEAIAQRAPGICRRVTAAAVLTEKQLSAILNYYRIFPFTDRLIIGILDGISGRSGCHALLRNGFTLGELVANGIYHLEMTKSKDKRVQNE